jgi:RNA polymerase sigma-70 factor, ECF subfamily
VTAPLVWIWDLVLQNRTASGKLLLLNYAAANMDLSEAEMEKLRLRLRFKVCHSVGFACADVDDIVQETVKRFILADQNGKMRNGDAIGAFLNGICQNVIFEYRRHWSRDTSMPESVPEVADKRLGDAQLFELREAIACGMQQLSARDRQVLRAFYVDEVPKDEILELMSLTDENFRVVLCRAKERFRQIYNSGVKRRAVSNHT